MTVLHLSANEIDVYASRRKWKNPSGTKTYFAWRNMRSRCLNPNSAAWKDYGGRGITICDRWADNYDAFFEDVGEAPDNLSLDRTDVNGNYEPSNCAWVTQKEQMNNTRSNRNIEHNGESLNLTQWAARLSIGTDTLFRRLSVYKMPLEKALTSGSLQPKWSHGTRTGYESANCRCDECRAAHAARHRVMRAKRKAKKALALASEMTNS